MLEMLREVAPQVSQVAVIYNPVQVTQVGMWRAIETAAPALSVEVIAASAGNADEITNFIESFAGKSGSGIIVLPSPVTNASRRLIIELMARHQLPAVYVIHILYGKADWCRMASILRSNTSKRRLMSIAFLRALSPATSRCSRPPN